MTREFRVAILGATGAVGRTFLQLLEERQFPISQLFPLASARSVGKTVSFCGKQLPIIDAATFDFSQADIGLFSAGGSVSAIYAPIATKAGCLVIDNTSYFRYEKSVPLIVPEINLARMEQAQQGLLIANPNCSTIQLLVAIHPIHDSVGIERVDIASYQAVSGTGQAAITELREQTQAVLSGQNTITPRVYPTQIAFNAIPQVDVFQPNGYTREEMKIIWETHKILEDETIAVNPTCVRIPVQNGHSEAVHLTLRRPINVADAVALLRKAPGVIVLENEYATPVTHADGHDKVFVSRIRQLDNDPYHLNLWIVADNLRKGAALNAIQIAQAWIERY